MKNFRHITRLKEKHKLHGEMQIFFLSTILPLFILFSYFSMDLGGFLLMRSMARTYCDASAVAASQAIDLGFSGGTYGGEWKLNENWAKERSQENFNKSLSLKPRSPLTRRMNFYLVQTNVVGRTATVVVYGEYHSIWIKNTFGTYVVTTKSFETALDH